MILTHNPWESKFSQDLPRICDRPGRVSTKVYQTYIEEGCYTQSEQMSKSHMHLYLVDIDVRGICYAE